MLSKLPSLAELTLRSPLVRTNPVTGWKSLFGAAGQVDNGWIEGVTKRESEILKKYCMFAGQVWSNMSLIFIVRQLISENHDLQVRLKWNTNDLAIWDK
jgi:alpha-ketoglutarate-dependent taurine dioxygenase